MNYRKFTVILSLMLSMEIAAHGGLIIENITLIDARILFDQTKQSLLKTA
ncbi:MAG: hypothetical protein Ct9H300mP6_02120 [Gammaproteobacteria bacterium]|nr:MAG: hypothetical protein Ct9H300mP6_02120 [Gammaproteobacteria bacterium]